MAVITIWHNPRCSKSRQTLALIQEHAPSIRKYLEDAPTRAEIEEVRGMLGVAAIDMMRPKEALFDELGLRRDMADEELVAAMSAHPKLIERPIVITDGRAAIGRPPETVLELI